MNSITKNVFFRANPIQENFLFKVVSKKWNLSIPSIPKTGQFSAVRHFCSIDNTELQERLDLANDVLESVHRDIKKVDLRDKEEVKILEAVRGETHEIYQKQPPEKKNLRTFFSISSHVAKANGYGSFHEMAATALEHVSAARLFLRSGVMQVRRSENELVPEQVSYRIPDANIFYVFGLSLSVRNFQAWENAVVLDFHRDRCYPLSEMYDQFHYTYGLTFDDEHVTAKMDPTKDSMDIVCPDILSSSEFLLPFKSLKSRQLSGDNLERIAESLDGFHETQLENLKDSWSQTIPLTLSSLRTTLKQMEGKCLERLKSKVQKIPLEPTPDFKKAFPKLAPFLWQCMRVEAERDFRNEGKHMRQIHACLDHVSILNSQLQKFQNPKAQLFEI